MGNRRNRELIRKMKLTANFQLQELVHPEIYARVGARCADWLHPSLVTTLQQLRDDFGPIEVNTWVWGGAFVDSGLRKGVYEPSDNELRLLTSRLFDGLETFEGYREELKRMHSKYAEFTAHRGGTAADLKFEDADPEQVQHYILANPNKYSTVVRMENAQITNTWLHLEVGVRHQNIQVFDP